MHKSNGTHLPDSTFPLSPEERSDLRAQSQKHLIEDEEKRSQFKEESLALKINPDATTTLVGKRIQNNRSKGTGESSEQQKINQIFSGLALGGFSLQSLTRIASAIVSLTSAFASSVAAKPSIPDSATADAHNIYDTERVTYDTYKTLKQESEEIFLQEQLVEEIEDPVEYMRELQNFAERANGLDMRPHPVTGAFVHSHDRVRKMEETAALNSTLIEPKIHGVMIFRPLSEIRNDVRGLNVVIADQYDQNPDGTLEQVNMSQIEARPIQPPGRHYIG